MSTSLPRRKRELRLSAAADEAIAKIRADFLKESGVPIAEDLVVDAAVRVATTDLVLGVVTKDMLTEKVWREA